MESNSEMIESIHLGMRKGYYTNLEMKNRWVGFDKTMIECLLTVFVAIELKDFHAVGANKEIKLEYPLFEFYNKAFPENKWTNENELFKEKELIIRDFNENPTKKRIDIAVIYNEPGIYGHYRSVHGIEIKAINGSNSDIIKDLNRLSKSMLNKSSIDQSSIQSCYKVFLLALTASEKQCNTSCCFQKLSEVLPLFLPLISFPSEFTLHLLIFFPPLFHLNISLDPSLS